MVRVMNTKQERVSDATIVRLLELEDIIAEGVDDGLRYSKAIDEFSQVDTRAIALELQQLRAALPKVRAALVDVGSFKLHGDKVVLHRHLAHEALTLLDFLELGE